jgi:putative transcriptional regulator
MEESLTGQLLLAAPNLPDPNFRRAVVLVGAHDEHGALGVILNRPSKATIDEVLPQLELGIEAEEQVYLGGPVESFSVVVLAEFSDLEAAGLLVLGRIGFPSPRADMTELITVTARRRVFAGYAGWGAGQLDEELERGDWITHPAQPEDIFCENPERLWSLVLERKSGVYSLLARMPPDPSMN